MANTFERGQQVTFSHTLVGSHQEIELSGTVTAFNYFFERLDALYVDVPDHGNMLVWLYQIK
jgi:hypothetical protein